MQGGAIGDDSIGANCNRTTALVTGATGFIGSCLVARLLHGGSRVLALSRNDPEG